MENSLTTHVSRSDSRIAVIIRFGKGGEGALERLPLCGPTTHKAYKM